MLKKFFVLFAIALTVLLVLCWIYLPAFTRYRELRSESEDLKQKIRELDEQIKVLADERHLLQTDLEYLEKVIREELGFVKPGEIVYELVAKKETAGASSGTSGGSVTPQKASTSVVAVSADEKVKMSPASLAASLANATPKTSKKSTSKTVLPA